MLIAAREIGDLRPPANDWETNKLRQAEREDLKYLCFLISSKEGLNLEISKFVLNDCI